MELIFVIPIVIQVVYVILTCTKWFQSTDKKIVRRIYYLLALIWSYMFINKYYAVIMLVEINSTLDINKTILNTASCIFLLFTVFWIWDFVFISSKNVSSFSLKDLSFTTATITNEEFAEAAKAAETKYQDYAILERITEIQYNILCEMYSYVNRLEYIEDHTLYRDILNIYVSQRKEIHIHSFTFDSDGLKTMKKHLGLNDLDFASIQRCLELNRVCATHVGNCKDRLFVVINTKFFQSHLVVIITGHQIMRNEHLVVQNIISYFDAILELSINEMNLEEHRKEYTNS